MTRPQPFVGPRLPQALPPPEQTFQGTMEQINGPQDRGPQYMGGPIQFGAPPDVGNLISGIENVQGYGEQRARGVSELGRFATEAAAPLIGTAVAARPLSTLMGMGTGMAAQHGTETGLRGLGVQPGYAQLAGDIAGLGAGVGIGALHTETPRFNLRSFLKDEEGASRHSIVSGVADAESAPKKKRLYRAADDDIVTDNASFSTTREAAQAYLDNPGFGGRSLYRADVEIDPKRTLDLFDSSDPIGDIMKRTGLDHPGAIGADEWVPRVSSHLREKDIDWVRVRESYPENSETWIWVGGDDPEMIELPLRKKK